MCVCVCVCEDKSKWEKKLQEKVLYTPTAKQVHPRRQY